MDLANFFSVVNRMFKGSELRLAFEVFMVGVGVLLVSAGIVIKPTAPYAIFLTVAVAGLVASLAGVARLVLEFFTARELLLEALPPDAVAALTYPDDMPWYRQSRPNLGRVGLAIFAGCFVLFFLTPWGYSHQALPAYHDFKGWAMTAYADPLLKDGFSRFMATNFQMLKLATKWTVWILVASWGVLELYHALRAIKQASKSGFFRT